MSTANPNPMEKSMVSVLVVANAGGGVAVAMWYLSWGLEEGGPEKRCVHCLFCLFYSLSACNLRVMALVQKC
jgi:hypothetical protein